MKYIVQEVILVLIITIISVTVALLIASSVQSEPLHMKDTQWGNQSKAHNIENLNNQDIRLTGIKIK